MKLWGQEYSRRELEGFTGDLRQIADIRLATLSDGTEQGTRVALIRTGSGLEATVLLDRAMDIGAATYNGIPLAWQSGTGAAHPSRYEPTPRGWLNTFHGGLLALCGLTHAGQPTTDPETGEALNLHGRIGAIPAYDIHIERDWAETDEKWTLRLRGTVDEISIFQYRLRLERTIEFTVGEPTLWVYDRVRNMGGVPAPLMVLYHCNFGWPIVSPDSEIVIPSKGVTATPAGQAGIKAWHQMDMPTPGYAEQVFFHQLEYTEALGSAKIINKQLGLGVEILFDQKTINSLTEWKQMGFGDYVVGIEPGNCIPEGRVKAREAERLQTLSPDESTQFRLGFRMIGASVR